MTTSRIFEAAIDTSLESVEPQSQRHVACVRGDRPPRNGVTFRTKRPLFVNSEHGNSRITKALVVCVVAASLYVFMLRNHSAFICVYLEVLP